METLRTYFGDASFQRGLGFAVALVGVLTARLLQAPAREPWGARGSGG